MCAYRCAQLSYATEHGSVLIIFPLYLRTTIMAQMLSIRGDCSKLHDPLNLLLKAPRKLTAEIRESKHVYLYTNDVCKKKARRYRVQGVLSFTCGLIWWTVRVCRNQVCVSRGSESNLRCRPREVSPRNEAEICPDNTTLHAHTRRHTQPFNSPLSGTTQVGCMSFINFLHLLRSIASSLSNLHA